MNIFFPYWLLPLSYTTEPLSAISILSFIFFIIPKLVIFHVNVIGHHKYIEKSREDLFSKYSFDIMTKCEK